MRRNFENLQNPANSSHRDQQEEDNLWKPILKSWGTLYGDEEKLLTQDDTAEGNFFFQNCEWDY